AQLPRRDVATRQAGALGCDRQPLGPVRLASPSRIGHLVAMWSVYERFAIEHPWLAAVLPALAAGGVSTVIAEATTQQAGLSRVGFPVSFASWLILGAIYRR